MKVIPKTLGICVIFAALAWQPRAGIAAERPATDAAIVATDARLAGDETRTRFVVDLSRSVEIAAFTLADPYRVVVDLQQVTFELPQQTGETGRGLVKAFRFGLVMTGASRIVLDLTRPARIDKVFVLAPVDTEPARLVLDLVAIDRDTFMRNIAADNNARRSDAARTPARTERDPGRVNDPRPLIVLDPGHGGLDSGTTAAGAMPEKTIVLEFAQVLRDKLEKTGKYRVTMTRTDDQFIALGDRVQFARDQKAALFVSIHADALAHHDTKARGATIYTLSETASDAEAARLAEAENRADVIGGVDLSGESNDVADILIDLAQRETKTFSTHFARTLVRELRTAARLHKNPLKSAGFRVLKAPDIPSVLIELGYVSNGDDLKLLTSDTWRAHTADAIVSAVGVYFATRIAGAARQPARIELR